MEKLIISDTVFSSGGHPVEPLIPGDFQTHVVWDREYQADFGFVWLGLITGKYKCRNMVKRLKRISCPA